MPETAIETLTTGLAIFMIVTTLVGAPFEGSVPAQCEMTLQAI